MYFDVLARVNLTENQLLGQLVSSQCAQWEVSRNIRSSSALGRTFSFSRTVQTDAPCIEYFALARILGQVRMKITIRHYEQLTEWLMHLVLLPRIQNRREQARLNRMC